jgi:hypothetical protein
MVTGSRADRARLQRELCRQPDAPRRADADSGQETLHLIDVVLGPGTLAFTGRFLTAGEGSPHRPENRLSPADHREQDQREMDVPRILLLVDRQSRADVDRVRLRVGDQRTQGGHRVHRRHHLGRGQDAGDRLRQLGTDPDHGPDRPVLRLSIRRRHDVHLGQEVRVLHQQAVALSLGGQIGLIQDLAELPEGHAHRGCVFLLVPEHFLLPQ